LLRNVVAIPNKTPDTRTRESLATDDSLVLLKLFVNRRQPRNDKKAHELSAYGADKNNPAGDIMWKAAAAAAVAEDSGNMANVS